jgi:PGF-pre-PGF domain-containing protein
MRKLVATGLVLLALFLILVATASADDPFTDPGRWEYFNLTTVHPALKAGFAGGIAHGNYVYYVPYTNTTAHGWTVRYDTSKPFTSASSWEYNNLQTINASLRYFFGGTAHGNYVYYVPDSSSYGWTVARYDSTQPFTSPSAWSWFNLSQVDVNLRGFCGATVSGDYIYLAPHYRGSSAHGTVVRYDTTREFTSPSAWSSFDMTTVNAGLQGYEGAVTVGDHVYFIPFYNSVPNSLLARYNTTLGFTDPAAWSYFDTATVESHLTAFEGGAEHGGYLFLTPSDASTYSLIAARYDTAQDLTSPSAYAYFNLSSLNPNLGNYLFSDALGDFVYYAPYSNAVTYSGWAARYNTSREFTSPSAWSYYNMTTLNGTLAGFFGCVGSGNHVYFVPKRGVSNYPGMTARFYALTAPGASFVASPLSGTAPLTVTFTDASLLSPTTWSWDFGDRGTSSSQNPSYTYRAAGTYTVSLTVTNAEGSDTMTRAGYITVAAPASPQTGSSGGGGDSSTTTSASLVSRVKAGEETVFPFRNRALPVVSINLSIDRDAAEVLMTEVERSLPAGIPAPDLPVHRYEDISLFHVPEDAVIEALIGFRVPRSWVEEQKAEPFQVVLLRYHKPSWEELPTEFLGEEESDLFYRATTPGFSLFAIGVNLSREPPETPEPAVTATTAPPETLRETISPSESPLPETPRTPPETVSTTPIPASSESSSPIAPALHPVIGIAAVVVLAVGIFAWRHTRTPPLRRKRGGSL